MVIYPLAAFPRLFSQEHSGHQQAQSASSRREQPPVDCGALRTAQLEGSAFPTLSESHATCLTQAYVCIALDYVYLLDSSLTARGT